MPEASVQGGIHSVSTPTLPGPCHGTVLPVTPPNEVVLAVGKAPRAERPFPGIRGEAPGNCRAGACYLSPAPQKNPPTAFNAAGGFST